jgi:hypothetical protein
MPGTKARGSELLKRRLSEKDLSELIDIEQDGVELLAAFPLGIPDPDGVWGVWRVRVDAINELIAQLLNHRHMPHFRVFPIGVPVIDELEVTFELGSAVQH